MGYSISFQPKDAKSGREMIAFMREHGRSLSQLAGEPDAEALFGPYWADGTGDPESRERGGLSYIHRRGHIGFDYGWDREYKFTLLRWMAQKVGKKKDGKARYLYDDCEWIDIKPEETDELGLSKRATSKGMFILEMGLRKYNAMKTEMRRLDRLWEERGK